MKNLYMPELAVIEDIKEETPNIRTLTVRLEKGRTLKSRPGQFVEMTIFGHGEFPVSVSGITGTDDNCFQATVQQTGKATGATRRLRTGSPIGIRGPFGNGFPLPEMQGKNVCIVTGGAGLAAVRHLVDYIIQERGLYGKVQLLHGAKTPIDLVYKDFLFDDRRAREFNIDILLTVDRPDDTWDRHVGVVTRLFNKAVLSSPNTVAVICGPAPMMKFACQALSAGDFAEDQILLSMERRMQCGIGMCGHCLIGQKQVCLDGPIFTYGSIKNTLERLF